MRQSSLTRSLGRLSLALAVAAISMSAQAAQSVEPVRQIMTGKVTPLGCPALKKKDCPVQYFDKTPVSTASAELFLDPEDLEDLDGDIEVYIKFKKRNT